MKKEKQEKKISKWLMTRLLILLLILQQSIVVIWDRTMSSIDRELIVNESQVGERVDTQLCLELHRLLEALLPLEC